MKKQKQNWNNKKKCWRKWYIEAKQTTVFKEVDKNWYNFTKKK